ncbi:hypothetical protein CLAFUR4_07467 [Fulvia fulva]|nr:hypothetical protein CLAFUR4_07467 [Fulvia fulva]KAK4622703.1 hypothetical protein CLAFUR0_07466 [Fulvia fulva]
MKSFTLATALAYAGGAAAFWRMPCRSETGFARIDPLVDPGDIADHVHTITGGGNFGPETTFEQLTAPGSCTSCAVKQDHSAYWTPALYFQHANGTTVMVQQVGGMLAYYLYYLDNVKAFPEGFAMIAGRPEYRNFTGPFPDEELSLWPTDPTNQFFLEQRALGFNCLNYQRDPEASLYRHQFPDKSYMDSNCVDGMRLELAFPSCGKKGVLDSEDHRSHVAYPSLVKEGNCPDGFDVHYPFLFFETIWATNEFAGVDGQFVLSTGDPVGTGYHGDFIMGWESEDFLQSALDTCKNPSGQIEDCALFTIQKDADADECFFDVPEHLKKDNCHGPRDGLPVGVPVQYGPEPATKYPVPGRQGKATTAISHTSAPPTYSQSAAPYSPADPEKTKTADAGIIQGAASAVNDILGHGAKPSTTSSCSSSTSSSSSSKITQAPAYSSASKHDNIFLYQYLPDWLSIMGSPPYQQLPITHKDFTKRCPIAHGTRRCRNMRSCDYESHKKANPNGSKEVEYLIHNLTGRAGELSLETRRTMTRRLHELSDCNKHLDAVCVEESVKRTLEQLERAERFIASTTAVIAVDHPRVNLAPIIQQRETPPVHFATVTGPPTPPESARSSLESAEATTPPRPSTAEQARGFWGVPPPITATPRSLKTKPQPLLQTPLRTGNHPASPSASPPPPPAPAPRRCTTGPLPTNTAALFTTVPPVPSAEPAFLPYPIRIGQLEAENSRLREELTQANRRAETERDIAKAARRAAEMWKKHYESKQPPPPHEKAITEPSPPSSPTPIPSFPTHHVLPESSSNKPK